MAAPLPLGGDHHTEDLFVDVPQGESLIRWICTLERDREKRAWRGLDILHVHGGRVTEKHTYAKAQMPLLEE